MAVFFSCDIGHNKSDAAFFEKVLAALKGIKPDEIVYWDDDMENVETANGLGIRGNFYDNFFDFQKAMKKEARKT